MLPARLPFTESLSVIRVAAVLALLLASAAQAAAPPRPPKLVVVLSLDQFSYDLYSRYRPTFTGGLARLASGESFVGYQSHAATETCPGHSTLLTGDHPARTGIAANNWFDRKTGSNIYCVTAIGTSDPLARTSAHLLVDTLGDWMRAKDPRSRVVSVSGKDRAAIMMAGHHPSAVFWWNDGLGFGTSRLAGPLDPVAVKTAQAFDQEVFAKWSVQAPALWPTTLPERCRALEVPQTFGKLALSGAVPPETAKGFPKGADLIADDAFNAELRASPSFDVLTLQFAERLLRAKKLGQGPAPDLLAVSLSVTDYLGHRFGNGGAEMCAQMTSVDAALAGFFADLDMIGVPYLVVLTADHGSIDAAERFGPPARRIDVLALLGQLSGYLRKTFGLEYDPLLGDDPHQIILGLAPADERRRAEILARAQAWLKERPEVAGVYTAAEVKAAVPAPGEAAADLTIPQRFHESYVEGESGDLSVNYLEDATLGVPLSPGSVVEGHGSPWDYDRRVPILFWWPGAPDEVPPTPIETVDIAPTLASILSVSPPATDGKCVDLGQGCR